MVRSLKHMVPAVISGILATTLGCTASVARLLERGNQRVARGDHIGAAAEFENAMIRARREGSSWGEALAHEGLGDVAVVEGRYVAALDHYRQVERIVPALTAADVIIDRVRRKLRVADDRLFEQHARKAHRDWRNYEDFASRYPNSLNRDRALAARDDLQYEPLSRQATYAELAAFLDRFPTNRHASTARARIVPIERAIDDARFDAARHDPVALEAWLAMRPFHMCESERRSLDPVRAEVVRLWNTHPDVKARRRQSLCDEDHLPVRQLAKCGGPTLCAAAVDHMASSGGGAAAALQSAACDALMTAVVGGTPPTIGAAAQAALTSALRNHLAGLKGSKNPIAALIGGIADFGLTAYEGIVFLQCMRNQEQVCATLQDEWHSSIRARELPFAQVQLEKIQPGHDAVPQATSYTDDKCWRALLTMPPAVGPLTPPQLRSIEGVWAYNHCLCGCGPIQLRQAGTTLSGQLAAGCSIAGTVSQDGHVAFSWPVDDTRASFSGQIDSSGNRIVGTWECPARGQFSLMMTMTRQGGR